jgi:glycosyltransferase involved in cell wall biosynthesis
MKLRAYVLTKNEEANIAACLRGLSHLGAPVCVLDSGSTDATTSIARTFSNVSVDAYRYVDHMTAYNELSRPRAGEDADYVIVLDADMVISPALAAEVLHLMQERRPSVIVAPILMYWDGRPLRWGSLCPPKPIVFRTGSTHFVPRGHAEALKEDVHPVLTREKLIHDDHKPYRSYLESQARYAEAIVERLRRSEGSVVDRIRAASPLMLLASPFLSYVARAGFLSGRTGVVYALDRLITEAIVFRRALARPDRRPKERQATLSEGPFAR